MKDAMVSRPLKYFGGKTYLAPRVVAEFPVHTHYVEPFFGGGAVLFSKPLEWVDNHSEVVNDLSAQLMNFWRVLRDDEAFGQFRRRCECTSFSETEWRGCTQEILDVSDDDCNYIEAWKFFVRYRQSCNGAGRSFAPISRARTRRGMNEQASAWLSAVEGLVDAHNRLQRVVILNRDAMDVIRQQDGPATLFYLDPPYMYDTRRSGGYECEMDRKQHEDLLGVISRIKGKFILSGYPHPLYDTYQKGLGWRCVRIDIDNKASHGKTKPRRTECMWMNFDAEHKG